MPERFHFPSAHTQLWLPLQLDPNEPYSEGFKARMVQRMTTPGGPCAMDLSRAVFYYNSVARAAIA